MSDSKTVAPAGVIPSTTAAPSTQPAKTFFVHTPYVQPNTYTWFNTSSTALTQSEKAELVLAALIKLLDMTEQDVILQLVSENADLEVGFVSREPTEVRIPESLSWGEVVCQLYDRLVAVRGANLRTE